MTTATESRAMMTCPECGGYGSIDATTFGEYGRHSCYRCGETGVVPVKVGDERRRELKAEARDWMVLVDRYQVEVHSQEGYGATVVATARTPGWAHRLARLQGDDWDAYGRVYDRVERRYVGSPAQEKARLEAIEIQKLSVDDLPF